LGTVVHVELFQAEWCPHSHRVRQRLTELGVDFRARQVPADKRDRDALDRETGTREIPVLVAFDEVVRGADEIIRWLEDRFTEQPDAGRHRAKARMDVPHFAEVR
jgi:glutaredoxin